MPSQDGDNITYPTPSFPLLLWTLPQRLQYPRDESLDTPFLRRDMTTFNDGASPSLYPLQQ